MTGSFAFRVAFPALRGMVSKDLYNCLATIQHTKQTIRLNGITEIAMASQFRTDRWDPKGKKIESSVYSSACVNIMDCVDIIVLLDKGEDVIKN